MTIRVTVNKDVCTCEMNCVQLAPQVFAIGEDSIAHVLVDEVPPGLRRKIVLAVGACPVQAITMHDDASGEPWTSRR